MRSQKIILLAAAVFCLTLSACTKQDLNEDEQLKNDTELIYATGGQTDQNGGLD